MNQGEEEMPQEDYLNVGTAPFFPNGLGVAVAEEAIIVTFYFVPPEDQSKRTVLGRVVLIPSAAEQLADALKAALKEQGSSRS